LLGASVLERSRDPLSPERVRAWILVVREALLVVALAYVVGRGILTGELSPAGVLEAIRDVVAALDG
jgi:hypothetical protein